MKKIISLLLLLSIALFAFASCGEKKDDTQLRIGYLAGPTGMGMAKLIHDNGGLDSSTDKYTVKKYETTQVSEQTADLIANKIDIACIPTNNAANLYNKNGDIVVLAVNTLSTLYLVTDKNTTINSFAELEGKTVYTCEQGTPKIVLESLIKAAGVNATVATSVNGNVIPSPDVLGTALVNGSVDIAVVPEPILSKSMLQIKKANNSEISYSVDINLNDVWNQVFNAPMTMGCVVARKDFVNEHKSVINSFLKDYKASIEYISNTENSETAANYIVESGVIPAAPLAKSALANLKDSIDFVDGEDMKNALEGFYTAIGIKAPDKNFYYEK